MESRTESRTDTQRSNIGRPGTGPAVTPSRPGPAAPGGSSWMPLLAVSLGYFMVILDATAVNLALPALRQDLGGGITGLQWVIDGYTLAFAALLLSAGVAGDRLGARRVFLAGLALFTAASAGCALAPAIGVLVLIRLVQGAAALLVPSSLSLLQASYPDRARRARAVGSWGGIGGLAAASGPVLGGGPTAAVSWRLVFAVNVPVGLAAAWLTVRRVASPGGARDRRAWPCAAARSCSGTPSPRPPWTGAAHRPLLVFVAERT